MSSLASNSNTYSVRMRYCRILFQQFNDICRLSYSLVLFFCQNIIVSFFYYIIVTIKSKIARVHLTQGAEFLLAPRHIPTILFVGMLIIACQSVAIHLYPWQLYIEHFLLYLSVYYKYYLPMFNTNQTLYIPFFPTFIFFKKILITQFFNK